jgi:hypothetical protein
VERRGVTTSCPCANGILFFLFFSFFTLVEKGGMSIPLRLKLQLVEVARARDAALTDEAELHIFVSRHVTLQCVEIGIPYSSSSSALVLEVEKARPRVDGHYACLGFELHDTLRVESVATGKALGYSRRQPVATGSVPLSELLYRRELRAGHTFRVQMVDRTVGENNSPDFDPEAPQRYKVYGDLTLRLVELEASPEFLRGFHGEYDAKRASQERVAMRRLVNEYLRAYGSSRMHANQKELRPMHVPTWYAHAGQMPAAVWCMDVPPSTCCASEMALAGRCLRAALSLQGWSEEGFLRVASSQLQERGAQFDPAFNRVMKVLCASACLFANACDYASDRSGSQDVERFINVLRTLCGDCEDLAKLPYLMCWTLLLRAEGGAASLPPLLYWAGLAMHTQVPCMATCSAATPAMGGAKGAVDVINHIPSCLVPRMRFCEWFAPRPGEDPSALPCGGDVAALKQLATSVVPEWGWEREHCEAWMLEGTNFCDAGLKPHHLYYAEEGGKRDQVRRHLWRRESARTKLEAQNPALASLGIEVCQYNLDVERLEDLKDDSELSGFYRKPDCLWTPALLRWGVPEPGGLAVDFYLGYRSGVPGNYGITLRDFLSLSPDVCLRATYLLTGEELAVATGLLGQERPVHLPRESELDLSPSLPQEPSNEAWERLKKLAAQHPPPAELREPSREPHHLPSFVSYRVNHVSKFNGSHADALSKMADRRDVLGLETHCHWLARGLYLLELRVYPSPSFSTPFPSSGFARAEAPVVSGTFSRAQHAHVRPHRLVR